MKLIFFDETKNNDDYPHYHIGGVGIDEEHLGKVEARINEVVKEAFGNSRLESSNELHAAEIYHRKKNFKSWSDFEQRIALLEKLMHILSIPEIGDCKRFCVSG